MKRYAIFFYALFLICFVAFSYLFIDPNISYLRSIYTDFFYINRGIVTLLFALIILSIYVLYFSYITPKHKKKITLFSILFSMSIGILIFSYPAMLSYDIFNYALSSKVLYYYQENPYIVYPVEFVGEPYLTFTRASNKLVLYGPAWVALSAIPYIISFGNFLMMLFSFKLLVISFFLGCILLIWKLTKKIESVVLFSFQPLILLETVVSGHNDIVMMFFVLLSFFLLRKNFFGFAIVAFVLSILIKYATLILFPVFLYSLWKVYKTQEVEWDKIYFFSAISMMIIFFLSPLREELYPWYATWFLSFVVLIPQYKKLFFFSMLLSLGLELSYIPYMFSNTYSGKTPLFKNFLTVIPLFTYVFYILIKKKVWQGRFPIS